VKRREIHNNSLIMWKSISMKREIQNINSRAYTQLVAQCMS